MPQTRAVRINGPALRDLREQRGLTVRQLAARIGRHPQSIRRLETGDGKFAGVVFGNQLANGLATDLADFTFPEDEDETNGSEQAA